MDSWGNHTRSGRVAGVSAALTAIGVTLGMGVGCAALAGERPATGALRPAVLNSGAAAQVALVAAGAVDVRAHGAKGDDQTDDHDAIQRALKAAGPGGEVRFPPGTYRVVGSLSVPTKITISGIKGQSRVHFIRGAGPLDNVGFMIDARGPSARFEDIAFRDLVMFSENRPIPENKTMAYAIFLMGGANPGLIASDITVTGCEFYHFRNGAFSTNRHGYFERLRFERNELHDLGTEVMGPEQHATGGVIAGISRDSVISFNTFRKLGSRRGDWALYTARDNVNLRVEGNTVRDCYGGLKFGSSKADRLQVLNNTIDGCTWNSIVMDSGVSNARFAGNQIRPNPESPTPAIWINTVTDSVFEDNVVDMRNATANISAGAGILLISGVTRNVEIRQNKLLGPAALACINFNGAKGVDIADVTIRDNELENTGRGLGIFINEVGGRIERPKISGNRITTKTNVGVVVKGAVMEPEVTLNTIDTAGATAIRFDGDAAQGAWVRQNRAGRAKLVVGGRQGVWEENEAGEVAGPAASMGAINQIRRKNDGDNAHTITSGQTPSIAGSSTWTLDYSRPTVIRDLKGGKEGMAVRLLATNGNVTIESGDRIQLAPDKDRTLPRGGSVSLLYKGGRWVQQGGVPLPASFTLPN